MNNIIDKTKPLPEPWYWTDQDLTKQLRKEISFTHVLFFRKTKTIARREDCDDVLFELRNHKFAVVHLTWQQFPHTDRKWPQATIYKNWQDVYEKCILIDNADHNE